VPDTLVELPDGDISALLPLAETAVFMNLQPGVDADDVLPRQALTAIFGNKGPSLPLATWTPGEIGLQHGLGIRAAPWLKDHDVPVPDEWYVVTDSPRRGLVVRTYDTPIEDVLTWLVRAATRLCPYAILMPWQAVVRTR
jgi:hypothetical protein